MKRFSNVFINWWISNLIQVQPVKITAKYFKQEIFKTFILEHLFNLIFFLNFKNLF